MPMKTQEDHVMADQMHVEQKETTVKVSVPGMQKLHEQPTAEIAEVLANVLRSRPNIVKMTYVVGQYIELTSAG